MTEKIAGTLIPGSRVVTIRLPPGEVHSGIVTKTGTAGCTIQWDDGLTVRLGLREMEPIRRE